MIRIKCRKCGAVLPGPVRTCPICHANQEPKVGETDYKVFVAIGFVITIMVVLGLIMALAR